MNERETLAAELALRLHSGGELAAAQAKLATDPELAAMVVEWEARLAPLAGELTQIEPGPELWDRISTSLAARSAGQPANDNPMAEADHLRQRLRRWQWGSLTATAAALALGLLVAPSLPWGTAPGSEQQVPGASALFASLPVGSASGPRLGLTYLPQSQDLLVMAGDVAGDGIHDHELWLVVPGAKPVSMGVIAPGRQSRVKLSPELAVQVAAGLDVVLTREPIGGAPPGGTAGPVVAEGKFLQI
jgi:anti-sigma-K factor RskA